MKRGFVDDSTSSDIYFNRFVRQEANRLYLGLTPKP